MKGSPRKQPGLWDLPEGGPLASAHAPPCPISSHSLTPTLSWICFSKPRRSSDGAIFSRLFWKDCCQNPSHLAHLWFYSIALSGNQPPGPMCGCVFWTPQVCLLLCVPAPAPKALTHCPLPLWQGLRSHLDEAPGPA